MSDRIEGQNEPTQDPTGAEPETDTGELQDTDLEEASGGVVEGGCIRLPWEPTPTFPTF